MKSSFVSQSLIYGVSTVLSRGIAVVLLLILPAFLQPEEYGAFGILMASVAILATVVPLEISIALARFYSTAEPARKQELVRTAWQFTLLMILPFSVVCLLFGRSLCVLLLGNAEYLQPFLVGVGLLGSTCALYFLQAQFRWEFRATEHLAVTGLFSVLAASLSILFILGLPDPLTGALIGQLAAGVVAASVAAYLLRRSLWGRFRPSRLKQMLLYSLPLVPGNLAIVASQYASRFFLNGMGSLEEVGVYTYASQIAGLVALAMVAVQSSITPLIMAHFEEPETPGNLARLFEIFVVGAAALCVFLGLFAPELILLVGNASYAGAAPLVLILAPATVASGLYVFAPGFLIAKKTSVQMLVSLIGAIVVFTSNYLLIGWFGMEGAAWATLLGSLAFTTLWIAASHSYYPVPFRWGRLALFLVGAGVLALIGNALPGDVSVASVAGKLALVGATFAIGVALGCFPLRAMLAMLRAWVPTRPRGESAGG